MFVRDELSYLTRQCAPAGPAGSNRLYHHHAARHSRRRIPRTSLTRRTRHRAAGALLQTPSLAGWTQRQQACSCHRGRRPQARYRRSKALRSTHQTTRPTQHPTHHRPTGRRDCRGRNGCGKKTSNPNALPKNTAKRNSTSPKRVKGSPKKNNNKT